MKVNTFLTAISIVLASLIAYLMYNIAEGHNTDVLCGIGSTVCFIATLIPLVGLQYKQRDISINVRVLSVLFVFIFLISNTVFAIYDFNAPYYIVVNGIVLVMYLAIWYKLLNVNTI